MVKVTKLMVFLGVLALLVVTLAPAPAAEAGPCGHVGIWVAGFEMCTGSPTNCIVVCAN